MPTYCGVGGVARKLKEWPVGIDGIVRQQKEVWAGVNGVSKQIFSSGPASVSGKSISITANPWSALLDIMEVDPV